MLSIIPEVIINTHILPRLPSKSIGQFRCVSKRWLSLLTDPHFIQTHQKTRNTNCFIFEESNDDKTLYSQGLIILESSSKDGPLICSVPYNNNNHGLHHLYINGSVNGLVLATCFKSLPHKDFTYLVLNLTTKDYVELPSSMIFNTGTRGFGYDSVSGDYKIVFFSGYNNYNRDVYLYNLRTNTTKLVMSHSPYRHINMLPGVFVNGFLHWIFNNSSKELIIVAFSFADEKLSEVPPPSQVDLSDIDAKLVSLGDKLALFHQVKGEIWVMNVYEVHKSWTKILVNGFNEISLCKPVTIFYDNGKLLFLTSNRLWIYDVEDRNFSESVDISYMKIKCFIGAYAESLLSPKFSTSE